MINPYFIQLIGILLTGAGMVALAAAARIFGKPLTREERLRSGNKPSGTYSLPINLETVASAAMFVTGIGILTWSKFKLCTFLIYWIPKLPPEIRFWLSCR